MSLIATARKTTAPIPEGSYVAVCYGVIDAGTQYNAKFGNEAQKVLLLWEIAEVRGDFERDGKKLNLPRVISKRYTLSLSEKANLRRDLESWRGRKFTPEELRKFDVRALLGVACQMQIVHETGKDGAVYANVGVIMALPRGTSSPPPENPTMSFSFDDEPGNNLTLPVGLPAWIADLIKQSKEWEASRLARASQTVPGPDDAPNATGTRDEVPF